MQLYESIFIIRPSASDDETNQLIEKMKSLLQKAGASILILENWGKKKLAYEIKGERRGTFVYIHFRSAGTVVDELERAYRLEDSVLKFLTVRVEHEQPAKPAAPAPVAEGAHA
ncbi:MAG: 30S ribosomal protein S6 [Nitrospira sp.]|nr:30S ribosomal protein S6 [Nitrospira sp.]